VKSYSNIGALAGRNEVRWVQCKRQAWRPHVRAWGLSEANVLYWRKYLWHGRDFSAPGKLCPPRYAPVR